MRLSCKYKPVFHITCEQTIQSVRDVILYSLIYLCLMLSCDVLWWYVQIGNSDVFVDVDSDHLQFCIVCVDACGYVKVCKCDAVRNVSEQSLSYIPMRMNEQFGVFIVSFVSCTVRMRVLFELLVLVGDVGSQNAYVFIN